MAQKQIRFLLGNQKITSKQQKLLRMFPKEQINIILKRDVVFEDVTRFELGRIMNILQNHQALCPKVYNHPIISTDEYEYGWQESNKCPDGKLYYIVYYDFLMVDIDNSELLTELHSTNIFMTDPSLTEKSILSLSSPLMSLLTEKLSQLGLTGRLYKTYNGYHIFITSRPFNHKSHETKIIMNSLNCDLFYIAFSFLNGFKVRLNVKLRDDETIAAEYIGIIGTVPEDPKLLYLLELHDRYIEQHKK